MVRGEGGGGGEELEDKKWEKINIATLLRHKSKFLALTKFQKHYTHEKNNVVNADRVGGIMGRGGNHAYNAGYAR